MMEGEGLYQSEVNISEGFPGGSVVKDLPAMQETWVQSLGLENPLEKEVVIRFSILFFYF